jgi:glutathione S-transferase
MPHKPAHMLALGPRGTVPLLALPDGTVLEESAQIMDWALQRDDGAFNADLDRYKYPDRFPADDAEHLPGARARALRHLEASEALLTEPFLDGATPGFFDAAIFPFIRQFSAVDEAWFERLPLPRVIDWRARMLEHPDFTTVMKPVPPWSDGDVPPSFRSTLR